MRKKQVTRLATRLTEQRELMIENYLKNYQVKFGSLGHSIIKSITGFLRFGTRQIKWKP